MSLLRKKMERKQGLKILVYGIDGSGKSVYGLGFPGVAILDAEAKMGVYEANPKFNQNMLALADTSNYYDAIDVLEEVIKGDACQTFMIDSETYVYESMQVSAMESEEDRARKKGNDPTDSVVAQRGWGKIKLNIARLRGLKAQASMKGITLICTAHKEDVMQKVSATESVKVGEKPSLRKNSQHEYDVILRFYKQKNIASGQMEYFAEVEKDTTETFKVGTIINSPCYENTYKAYTEQSNSREEVKASYDNTITDTMSTMNVESQEFDEVVLEFETLFKAIKDKDAKEGTKKADGVKDMLKSHSITSYKKPEFFEQLKEVVAEMRAL